MLAVHIGIAACASALLLAFVAFAPILACEAYGGARRTCKTARKRIVRAHRAYVREVAYSWREARRD